MGATGPEALLRGLQTGEALLVAGIEGFGTAQEFKLFLTVESGKAVELFLAEFVQWLRPHADAVVLHQLAAVVLQTQRLQIALPFGRERHVLDARFDKCGLGARFAHGALRQKEGGGEQRGDHPQPNAYGADFAFGLERLFAALLFV